MSSIVAMIFAPIVAAAAVKPVFVSEKLCLIASIHNYSAGGLAQLAPSGMRCLVSFVCQYGHSLASLHHSNLDLWPVASADILSHYSGFEKTNCKRKY